MCIIRRAIKSLHNRFSSIFWNYSFVYFWWVRVCWPLLCLCRPFLVFERCLDSNPESCRSQRCTQISRFKIDNNLSIEFRARWCLQTNVKYSLKRQCRVCTVCYYSIMLVRVWGASFLYFLGISMGFKMEHDRGIDKTIIFTF